jgi:hypothetical protein
MAFIRELEGHSLEELLETLDSGAVGAPQGERAFWLQEAARLVAEREGGLDLLLERLQGGDEDRLRAILLGLSFIPPATLAGRREEVGQLLLAHTQDPRPLIVAEAVDSLRHLGYAEAQAQIAPLLRHSSPHVVGAVLRFLSRYDPEAARPLLLDALRSPDPIIRQNGIDELDELGCVEALPAVRLLLTDPDEDVRQAAQTAVANLEERASKGE